MIPVIISPTRSWYSSNIMSRSASRNRWRITCLAVCAAMRAEVGRGSRRALKSGLRTRPGCSGSISGSSGSRSSPVSGSMGAGSSSIASATSFSSSSGGRISSNTRKSAVPRSMSTRAYTGRRRVSSCMPRAARPRAPASASPRRCPFRAPGFELLRLSPYSLVAPPKFQIFRGGRRKADAPAGESRRLWIFIICAWSPMAVGIRGSSGESARGGS